MSFKLKKCPLCHKGELQLFMRGDGYYKDRIYRCSNKKCKFSLRENYKEEEIYLQGLKLKSTCIYCGKPLVIASNSRGLYGTCYSCGGDVYPQKYNSKEKFANSKREEVKKEISTLSKNFNKKPFIESIIENIKEHFNKRNLKEVADTREELPDVINF